MLQLRHILRFSLVLVLLSVLFFTPWSCIERNYAHLFQSVNSAFFSRFWFWENGQAVFIDLRAKDVVERIDDATPGDLRNSNFRPMPPTDVLDTLVVVMNRDKPGPFGQFRVGSRLLGYWPMAWLVALILAKPLPWRRKGWALLFGVGILHAFLAWRMSIKLLQNGFALPGKKYALFQLGEFSTDLLNRGHQIFVEDPTASFIIPTLIWFIVAFTRHDWAALRQLSARTSDAAAPER